MHSPKIIIAGGGTGGHLFPAIAIGEEIKDRFPNAEIHFIGSKFGLESKVFPVKDLLHTLLPIRGLQRNFSINNILKNIVLPFRIVKSLFKVNSIYKEFKPSLIIGTGGYASAVPLMVAQLKNPKIPIILQEQNSFPGLTTRWFAKTAELICSSFDISKEINNERIVTTGNPIRNNILNGDKKSAIDEFELSITKRTIFIFGGSQGKINFKSIQILWQTGDKEYQKYEGLSNKNLRVVPFINDMASAYSLSDLVVCRSGALTLSEITACGKPSILIPFAAAAGNHQLKNAETLSKKGASILIEEKDLNAKVLLSNINNLINNESKLDSMSKASKNLGNPEATKMIVEQVIKGKHLV